MNKTNSMIITVIIGIIFIIGIGYYSWKFKRWANYSWSYETQVTQTVCDMVNPEYLIDPKKCQ